MKIAEFTNTGNDAIPFYGSDSIRILSDSTGSWECIRQVAFEPFNSNQEIGLQEIHRRMQKLINDLDDCRIFVATQIRGIPFAILDSEGFSIWKLEGDDVKLYDHIKQTIEQRQSDMKKSDEIGTCTGSSCTIVNGCNGEISVDIPQPVPTENDGEFTIDLIKIFENDSSLNSRVILIPFLLTGSFQKLEIICDHTPKWLSRDYEIFNVVLNEKLSNGICIVTVSPDGSDSRKSKSHLLSKQSCRGGSRSSCCGG